LLENRPLTDTQQKALEEAYLKCTKGKSGPEIDLANLELKSLGLESGSEQIEELIDNSPGIGELIKICNDILKSNHSWASYTKISRGNQNGDLSLHEKTAHLQGLTKCFLEDKNQFEDDINKLHGEVQRKAINKRDAACKFMRHWIEQLEEQRAKCVQLNDDGARAETRAEFDSRIAKIDEVLARLKHLDTHRFALDFAFAHPLSSGKSIQDLAKEVKDFEQEAFQRIQKYDRPLKTYKDGIFNKIKTAWTQFSKSQEEADPAAEQAFARDIALLSIRDRKTYNLVLRELGAEGSKQDPLEWALYHLADEMIEQSLSKPTQDLIELGPIHQLLGKLHAKDQESLESALKKFAPAPPAPPAPAPDPTAPLSLLPTPIAPQPPPAPVILPRVIEPASVLPAAPALAAKPTERVLVPADGNCFYYSALLGLSKAKLENPPLDENGNQNQSVITIEEIRGLTFDISHQYGTLKLNQTEEIQAAAQKLRTAVATWLQDHQKDNALAQTYLVSSFNTYIESQQELLLMAQASCQEVLDNPDKVFKNDKLKPIGKELKDIQKLHQDEIVAIGQKLQKLKTLTVENYLTLTGQDRFYTSTAEAYALSQLLNITLHVVTIKNGIREVELQESHSPLPPHTSRGEITLLYNGSDHFDAMIPALATAAKA